MKNLLSACLVQKQECESRLQAAILWFKKCNAFFFYTELRKNNSDTILILIYLFYSDQSNKFLSYKKQSNF